jgi:hypothetical protein
VIRFADGKTARQNPDQKPINPEAIVAEAWQEHAMVVNLQSCDDRQKLSGQETLSKDSCINKIVTTVTCENGFNKNPRIL